MKTTDAVCMARGAWCVWFTAEGSKAKSRNGMTMCPMAGSIAHRFFKLLAQYWLIMGFLPYKPSRLSKHSNPPRKRTVGTCMGDSKAKYLLPPLTPPAEVLA